MAPETAKWTDDRVALYIENDVSVILRPPSEEGVEMGKVVCTIVNVDTNDAEDIGFGDECRTWQTSS